MRRVTVYKAQPPWANQALRKLREAGLDAAIVHEPNPIVRQKAGLTLKLEVAVPEYQAEDAMHLLREWEREAAQRTRGISSRLVRDLIISFIPVGLLVLATFLVYGEVSEWLGVLGVVLWIVTVAVMGRQQRHRD